MRVTPDPAYAESLLAEARKRHPDTYRDTDLIHVSELITCLAKAYYGRVVGVPKSAQGAEDLNLMVGSAFHAWLEPEGEQPVILDGIIGRPDIREVEAGIELPSELKTTKLGSQREITDLGTYIDQVASYAQMMGVKVARLTVLHLNGNYTDDRGMLLRSWKLEFTDEELETWGLTLSFRRDILQTALENGTPPSTKFRVKGACQTCPYYKRICTPGNRAGWGPNFTLTEDDLNLDYADTTIRA